MTTGETQGVAPASDCQRAKRELEEYIHGELCAADAGDIRRHLETCDDCNAEHTVGVTLTNALKGACKEAAPEELRDSIMNALRRAQAEHQG
ncbi:zf-HC2 domain-containing protein [Agrococcus casei]|uniref:Putative zinc-finger domain-containing protein n=1 Tax=Agrococcus casei LMG 22410 TaxID=1255656 RepID=A0A1R4FKP3_9MICO|nr:zf-HC2 domain-containing protein [Agrococcus casei]SJM56505.1 hypothetical protein CZ674_05000 [Agrococcus casei LMG 22410]